MLESKHTSGPWHTDGRAIKADGSLVAHVVRDRGVDIEGLANAHLLAAAPDMLEALEAARKFIEVEYSDPSFEPYGEWLAPEARKTHARICAAIAKTEGCPDA